MWHDPIVEDIHKIREAYAAKFNNNMAAMVRDLQQKAKERQEHPIVSLPKTVQSEGQHELR